MVINVDGVPLDATAARLAGPVPTGQGGDGAQSPPRLPAPAR